MAEARYTIVETSTNLLVNIIIWDDSLDESEMSPYPGTYVVKITESTGEPTMAGTYDKDTGKFVLPKFLQEE